MGSPIRFDDIETEIGKRFPIQVVVCVSFSFSVETQMDSKSNIARLFKKSLFSSETGRLNPSKIFKPDFAKLINVLCVDMSHSILTSQEMLI